MDTNLIILTLASVLADTPIIGKIFFDQNLVLYLSFILIFVAWWYIFKTQPGLKLQGIGERPAVFARGTNVNRQRFIYTLIGGAAYSLFVKLRWSYHHTYGIGWIALAIVIFGGLQSVSGLSQSIPAIANVPTHAFQTAPFALMLIALLSVSNDAIDRFFSGSPISRKIWQSLRGTPPGALSTIFEQE
jgi:simple sugar transport system permease protein